MDLGASVVLTFLLVAIGVMYYHFRAQDRDRREDLSDVVQRQNRLERAQERMRFQVEKVARESANVVIKADAAIHTAQRTEERVLVGQGTIVDPTCERVERRR